MPRILVAGKIHADGLARLREAAGFTLDVVEEVSTASYAPRVANADAILIRTQPLPAEVIAAAKRLRIVSRHGVGYDAVDVETLNRLRIPLCIVGDVNSRAVAEHTLMLMLAAARRTVALDHAARTGGWNERNRFDATELDGKTLLILGFGRIGRRVAELARAFGMEIIVHDPFVTPEACAALGVKSAPDMAEGLARADVITLHMPASPAGPVITAARLAAMKPTAILVNAARGDLVDEAALDQALRNGSLRAAALDVLAEEPPPAAHPLLTNPRLTLSPHNAGLTAECAARMAVMSARNIIDFFAGRLDPALVVNRREIGLQ
jgi:D-3-phosphoglycerate dehydrogenase